MMSLFNLTKSISTFAGTLGLVTLSNLLLINAADAFSVTFQNGGFESTSDGESTGTGSPNNWSTIGDVYTTGTIDEIAPISGSNQAIITTGYIEGTYGDPVGNRNDDTSLNFNQSGTNPVSADTNSNGGDILQQHFGFGTDAFSIESTNPTIAGWTQPRTSKEGSGMYQQFNVTLDSGESSFKVSFDWSYLTNDGTTDFGEQDFAFWSLGQVNGSTYNTAFDNTEDSFVNSDEVTVLRSSSGSISTPSASDNYVSAFDYANNGRYSYTVNGLTPGTYTYQVGFGVVDVDNVTQTSALMIDNILFEEVPFEFTPSTGIGVVLGLIGINKLRCRFKK